MLAIAHRGASAYAPENTRAAFRRAIEMGADMIETDLQLTRDGAIVLVHDERIDRTTNGSGFVADHTLAALVSLDAGEWFAAEFAGERIVTLTEFEDEFASSIPACLEIKDPDATTATIDYLRATSSFRDAHLTSFSWESAVQAAASLDMPVGYLTREFTPGMIAQCVDHGLAQVCPHVEALDADLVALAHDRGLVVRAWGIRTPGDVDHLFATGVDGATSNWPDWITNHPQYRKALA
jgi:glycerophosphoryl diester phosphodiesterase